jgi:hypothetical protein
VGELGIDIDLPCGVVINGINRVNPVFFSCTDSGFPASRE